MDKRFEIRCMESHDFEDYHWAWYSTLQRALDAVKKLNAENAPYEHYWIIEHHPDGSKTIPEYDRDTYEPIEVNDDTPNEMIDEPLQINEESQIEIALGIALKAHKGQLDLDGKPVILHPLTVAMKGYNENEIVAGLLHDVVEDTGYTFDDLLAAGISPNVVDALRLLTHEKGTDYMEYVRRIADSNNPIAINVKCNDLDHNLARGRRGDHLKQVAKHTAAREIIQKVNGDAGAAWDLLIDLPGEGKYWQAKFAFQIEKKPIEEATAEAGITIEEYMQFFHPERSQDKINE